MENAQRCRQNTYPKKAFWAKYNGECVEVSAKYTQKKAFWAKYNMRRGFGKIHTKNTNILGTIQWRMHKGFGKIHTKKMHSGQNTRVKNCIWGKIQCRKA